MGDFPGQLGGNVIERRQQRVRPAVGIASLKDCKARRCLAAGICSSTGPTLPDLLLPDRARGQFAFARRRAGRLRISSRTKMASNATAGWVR